MLAVPALLRLALRSIDRTSLPAAARSTSRVHATLPARSTWPADAQLARLRRIVRPAIPLLPLLLFAALTLLATATSILPLVSWQGSDARAQGAMTTLAYLTLALLARGLTLPQVRRLAAAMALSGFGPAAYGWLQRFGRDPLAWQQPDLAARVPGSLGNPIFLGALLAMTLPLSLYFLVRALRPDAVSPVPVAGTGRLLTPWRRRLPAALAWSAVAIVEAGGLLFTGSRGPFAGLLAALAALGLGLATAWARPLLRRLTLAAALLAAAALFAFNVLDPALLGHAPASGVGRLLSWSPAASGTAEVRLLIWRPALTLVAQRPLLGCGPDTLLTCYYPVYPTALRHLEAPNAVPDRTHDIYLDVAVETGLLGLGGFLLLIGATLSRLWRTARRAGCPSDRGLAAALLAALAGHLAEGAFGIAIVATALLTWLIAGLADRLSAATATPSPTPIPEDASIDARPRPAGRHKKRSTAPDAAAPWLLRRRALATAMLLLACLGSCVVAWQVVRAGAVQVEADTAARQGSDLETVALGNSGQAPLPPGRHPQPILALRQFSAAAAYLQRAATLDPTQEAYYLDAGRTLVEWGQAAAAVGGPAAQQAGLLYAQALLDFGQAARLNPYDPDPLRDTGKAYERWAGLEHDPALPSTWDATKLQRAALAFARAAVLAPRHPDPLVAGAQVALWQGLAQRALQLAQQAVTMDPQMGDGYRVRAEAELALGRRPSALADLRQALRDPYLGQRGPTAAQLALAEATWAGVRCAGFADAHQALQAGGLSSADGAVMNEIVRVDATRCNEALGVRR